jgi:hypothetical protein
MPRKNEIDDDQDDSVELSTDFEAEARKAGLTPNQDDGDDSDDLSDDDTDDDIDGETDDVDGDSDDADGDGPDDADDVAASAATARVKPTAKERIKELATKRREAERLQFEAEMRSIELQRQLDAARQAAPPAVQVMKKPDPNTYKYGEMDSDYQDDRLNYRIWERDQKNAQTSQTQSQVAAEEQRLTHYRTRLETVIADGTKRYTGFRDAIDRTPYEPELARLVLDSDRAVDIAYHLSKNGADLLRLTRASKDERLRILGQLEGRLSVASTAKKATQAPPAMGSKKRAPVTNSGKYGPDDQDAFDRAFYSN